ncbi:hypothetical protein [Salibacter sp.]|uniref:hypothetical protein n=1 Tax=Salibacter sp. TaxID=2010995 RepID=UPI00286FFDE4|nr:hypothetical protein [Salibacter sp.]MDR9488261.1 hypothetical protein [Salibacter sp.]
MFKFLLLPLQILLIAGITSVVSKSITITQEAPERIDTMSSCTVSVTVNKGDVEGFAKFQHLFPYGVEIEPIETKGATFTYAQRKMKIIWMALPEEESFTVKYKLTVTDPYVVEVDLGGTFSYLEENKRMTYTVPTEKLNVGPSEEELKKQRNPYAYVYREVEDLGDNRYKIKINVNSQYLNGFGKIQDVVPYKATAEANNKSESVFSQVDEKVKFVWMSMPESDTFSVSYTVDLSETESKSIEGISGELSFLHENKTQKAEIMSEPPTGDEQEMLASNETPAKEAEEEVTEEPAQQPEEEKEEKEASAEENIQPQSEPEPEDTVTEKPADEGSDSEEKVEQPEPKDQISDEELAEKYLTEDEKTDESSTPDNSAVADTKKKSEKEKITSVQDPVKGIEYRVQILAGHKNVKAPYIEKKYNFTNQFFMENHEGWIKYTTGSFGVYKQARDGRENIKSSFNFPGPFVVAYNEGDRITVQEALMITNQNWVQ